MADSSAETVNTVMGSIQASELGETLTHEHLCPEYSNFHNVHLYVQKICEPPYKSICYKDIAQLTRNKVLSIAYSTLNEEEMSNVLINELNIFRAYNGKTIVENSSIDTRSSIDTIKEISKAIKVNVIIGTGFHSASMLHECRKKNMRTEKMYNYMYGEMEKGNYFCRDVKAGFLGKIRSGWPMQEYERYYISATALLQEQLRCPVSFQSENNIRAPFEILRLYQEAGGDDSKVIMSHVDYRWTTKENLLDFMDDNKCYVQFDKFGTECSLYSLNTLDDAVSDAWYIKNIALLKKEKLLHRVLISHNIQSKDRLMTFGGHGYVHIAKHIVPNMLANGFLKEDIDLLRIENPKRWLTRH